MIIFGTRFRKTKLDEGTFFCPHCQQSRQYVHYRAKRYLALYFIPLIPMGGEREFVECQTCGHTYEPTVLSYRPAPSPPRTATLAHLLNQIPELLKNGHPVENIVQQMTAAGLDRDIALQNVRPHLHDAKLCPTCGLTYDGSISICGSCQQPLT